MQNVLVRLIRVITIYEDHKMSIDAANEPEQPPDPRELINHDLKVDGPNIIDWIEQSRDGLNHAGELADAFSSLDAPNPEREEISEKRPETEPSETESNPPVTNHDAGSTESIKDITDMQSLSRRHSFDSILEPEIQQNVTSSQDLMGSAGEIFYDTS